MAPITNDVISSPKQKWFCVQKKCRINITFDIFLCYVSILETNR